MVRRAAFASVLVLAIGFAACEDPRAESVVTPYVGAVASTLDARCLRCHADSAPAGGWRAGSYLDAIGCDAKGTPVTLPSSPGQIPPMLAALGRPDHAGVAPPEELAALASWIGSDASRGGAGLHGPSFADPRSPASHGAALRARGYAPMTDPSAEDACGRCHDGAPRPTSIAYGAPGAPSCTSCHAEPNGPLACSTCHGSAGHAYPPRDRCFFPQDEPDHTHAAHAETSAARATGLPCSTCHPTPPTGVFGGASPHADGHVEVWLDGLVAGRGASFDAASRRCAGTCHDHGGARPTPAWGEASVGCGDCHGSPPAGHYAGPCTTCHHEANADGTQLTSPTLHLNGKIDLGDGSGKCGACHGSGDDPWPPTGAHRAHAQPKDAAPVACETCHEVPSAGDRHPLGGGAKVTLRLLATTGARRASYDPATKTCAGTYCHEGSGGTVPAPRWTDGAAASTCTSCHGHPPAPPHPAATSCDGATCHQGRTSGLAMTPAGRLEHVDGLIERGPL